MKLNEKSPPREYTAGYENKVVIKDCGTLDLSPDEQVTFVTSKGAEYDVTRKSWGFYATPSLNSRLKSFGLRPVLVRNRDHRFFVMLVEQGFEEDFQHYVKKEPLKVICWLDDISALQSIEVHFDREKS